MIIVVLALFLIIGFMIAEAILDYVFIVVYALVATALVNNIIHMIRYGIKHRKLCTNDLYSSLGYILFGVGAGVLHYFLS